jgi:hypothetical protein
MPVIDSAATVTFANVMKPEAAFLGKTELLGAE